MTASASPGILFTLAAFAVVIGILVFVHEFGHYGMARLFGIKVEAFSIGFGREIFGWTDKRGTRWRLGWLPLGGYAKFAGDMNAASQPDPALMELPPEERQAYFQFKPLWQRALVVAAGPLINFLFAILLFAGFFMAYGHQFTPPVVGRVMPGTPAAAAGIAPGDRFTSIDGTKVERFEDVMRIVSISTGQPMEIGLERDGKAITRIATPKLVQETDRFGNSYRRGVLGILNGAPAYEKLSPPQAIVVAARETGATVRVMIETMAQVITGRRPVDELGGPIKIAQYSGQTASLGLPALIGFVALISINLGFINLLPIPMLDGGHLFLYALEAVRRRPLNPKVQEWAFVSGFALIMSLMLFLTWNDLGSVGLWDKLAKVAS